jgi:anti-sigma factor RsiW
MSRPEENAARRAMNCSEAAPLLPFFASGDLEPQEREPVAAHLGACARCAAQFREERALLALIAVAPQPADRLDPSDILLSQCRSELAESLDDLAAPAEKAHWQVFGWFRRLMAFRPAWSAALLVLLGIFVGARSPLFQRGEGTPDRGRIVRAASPLTEEQLAKMAVAGINFAPSSDAVPGTVQLQLRAEQPFVLSGNLDDAGVRRVLTYVVEHGQRFDTGIRLDCLDALKPATKDADVRRALFAAARRDENPTVRLKVLDALRDSSEQADVRQVLLDTLEHDGNSGVRLEAVNLLVGSLQDEEGDPLVIVAPIPAPALAPGTPGVNLPPVDPSVARILRALENLTRRDPNRFVRLRSAAALRQIGPREVH